MIGNFYTLRWIASDLDRRLRGARLGQLFSQEKDELVIAFFDVPDSLVVSCRTHTNTCYVHPSFARAKRNTAPVFPTCQGLSVRSVLMDDADRAMTVALSDGSLLLLQFFASRANVLLVEGSVVVSAFLRNRSLKGTPLPTPAGESSLLDLVALESALDAVQPERWGALLRKAHPPLGPVLTQEVMHRVFAESGTGVPRPASVRGALLAVLSEVEHPRPRIILDDAGVPQQFTLIPLAHLSGRPQEEFASVHEAVRFFLGRSRAGVRFREKLSVLEGKLRQGVDRAHRTLEAVRADLERHDRAEEYERAGHLLMANITQLRKGAHEAVLADLDDPSAVVSVALDPALTPMENAQKYFDRARRSRQSHDETVARAGQLAGRVGRGTALLDLLHAVHTPEALAAFVEQHGPEMEEFNIGEKAEARQQIPFRIFMVDGGFEVWAGKSSTNNDELTLRHARPEDLWFHARGSSGSHVILKIASGKGEPSKKAREQAAAVAAYYSKMKTAGLVPVAMTEKKYVRKPKGAPPGTVTIEREKVLFVRPALPGPEKGSPLEP